MLNIKSINLLLIIQLFVSLSIKAQLNSSFTVNNSNLQYCKGDTVKFTNTSTGSFITTYWKFGDNIDTWTNNPEHIYQIEGDFTIWLIISDSNNSKDSTSLDISVKPSPTISLLNNTEEQSLTVDSDISDITYIWYFGTNLTDATEQKIFYFETGNYAVVASNEFCSDSASIYINVDSIAPNLPEIIVKNNILTPDIQDGTNDVLFIQDLSLYTNPVYLSVYNKWGQLVYENEQYTNLGGFSGEDNNGNKLDAGTYYYIVKCEGRKGGSGFVDLIR